MKDVINGFMLLAEWRAGYEDRRTLVPGTNTFHDCKDRIQMYALFSFFFFFFALLRRGIP